MAGQEDLELRSGRHVALHRVADGDGQRTIVFCHAAPGSGAFDPDPVETQRRNVTLIAVDRPGYGGSAPVGPGEWASVDGAADDLAEVLDDRVDGPVGVAGWSAGGRVALALAARRPELVDRVVVMATPAPNDQVRWIPGQIQARIDALEGKPADVALAALSEQLAPLVPADPASPDAFGLVGAGPADEAIAKGADGAGDRLATMLSAAFSLGVVGLASDIGGYTLRPWGFQPEDVQQRVLLLYGGRDVTAGGAHGRWWQRNLPNARLEVGPRLGHLLVIPLWKRALSFLAPGRSRG